MPIDIHAHYIPPQLIAAITDRGAEIGVRLLATNDGKPPAMAFDYGFKVRPFFPRLIEPAATRKAWLAEKRIDHQILGTWPDIFAYGLPAQQCAAWHRMLNDTLAAWCASTTSKPNTRNTAPRALRRTMRVSAPAGEMINVTTASISSR